MEQRVINHKKRQRRRNLCRFFLRDMHRGDIRRHSIIYPRYIIFRSDTGARDNSRESRKGSKGSTVVHPRTRSRPPFFLCAGLLRFFRPITSPRFVSRPPTRPCSQSMHRRSLPLDAHLTAASVTATITPTRADYRDLRYGSYHE